MTAGQKAHGVQIHYGYLMHHGRRFIPDALWGRVKYAAGAAGLLGELLLEQTTEDDTARTRQAQEEMERKRFRRWVERLFGPQTRWPWSSGWTPEELRSYLVAPRQEARP